MSLEQVKATTGRVLGVDYGEARTGLAISDATRFLASGIGNVQGGGLEKTAVTGGRWAAIFADWENPCSPKGISVMPMHMLLPPGKSGSAWRMR